MNNNPNNTVGEYKERETSLGLSGQDFYEEQLTTRDGPVQLGRRLADISSPSVFPHEHYKQGDDLPMTNQSINSLALNTLSSKMMVGAFPPGLPMADFALSEHKMGEAIEEDPKLFSATKYALSRREAMHRDRLETTSVRTAYVQTMKLKILTGNCLILWTDINNPVVYNMHRYAVKRDASGQPLVVVLKDSVSAMTADEDVVAAAENHRTFKGDPFDKADWSETIDIYHCQKLVTEGTKKEWLYWQETEGGYVIPDTEAWSPLEAPTMFPAGMVPVYGSDWFLPYCVDYEGDMIAVENYASASQDIASAAAWNPIFVNPTGQTDIRDVENADNLDTVPGRGDDLSSYDSRSGGDYQITASEAEKAERRLGKAFLSAASAQRSGERVTAFEWQKITAELDEALGGLYTMVSQTTQRFFVLRFIHLHQIEEGIPPLPEEWVTVRVKTGLDAMGQSTDYTNLMETVTEAGQVLGDDLAASLNKQELLTRIFSYRSIKSEGLVRPQEELEAEQQAQQQQAQQQMLLEQASGPIAKEGAAALGNMVQQQVSPSTP